LSQVPHAYFILDLSDPLHGVVPVGLATVVWRIDEHHHRTVTKIESIILDYLDAVLRIALQSPI
jgi:hypothetical protein